VNDLDALFAGRFEERGHPGDQTAARSALEISDTPDIRRREARLKSRIDRPRTPQLAL